jgi:F-type H+-transporting ATPase subunit delta
MSEIRIAYRYAKALLDLAIEKNELEQVHNDMQLFNTVCKQNRDFRLMLENPIILPASKLKVLDAIFAAKVNPMVMHFFQIITKKGRESYLPQVGVSFHQQYNEHMGIDHAIVTTTVALTDSLRKEVINLLKQITDRKIELEERVDPNLIGGFVLRVGDRQIDESINSKLRALKNQLTSTQYIRTI